VNVDWSLVAILVGVLVPSVILHEVAHGVVALMFGDDTAKRAGRLTLNPIAHVDPFGTLILPAMLALTGLGAFGYAKPVPVNPRRLRNPRQHSLYVSLTGPAVNIVLAVAAALVFRVTQPTGTAGEVVLYLGFVNVLLAVFNLLPIPPLDGSALIERVLPHRWWPTWLRFRQWSFGLLLIVVLLIPGSLSAVFDPALDLWKKLL